MENDDVDNSRDHIESLLSIVRSGHDSIDGVTDVNELASIYDECVSCFNDACAVSLDVDEDRYEELLLCRKLVDSIKDALGVSVRLRREEMRVFHSDTDSDKVKKILDLLIDFN